MQVIQNCSKSVSFRQWVKKLHFFVSFIELKLFFYRFNQSIFQNPLNFLPIYFSKLRKKIYISLFSFDFSMHGEPGWGAPMPMVSPQEEMGAHPGKEQIKNCFKKEKKCKIAIFYNSLFTSQFSFCRQLIVRITFILLFVYVLLSTISIKEHLFKIFQDI